MDRLARVWADYSRAPVPEWNHPIDARDFLRCIQRFQSDWYTGHVSRNELQTMIKQSTARLVWIPKRFHEAARIECGLFPFPKAVEFGRIDGGAYFPFLSFVEDMDLTTFENRCIHLPYSSDFYYLLRGHMFDFSRKHLNLDRLAWVKQLGYLGLFYGLVEKQLPDPDPHHALHHSRLQHSLLVSALMEAVMTRLGIPEHGITEAAFAALHHDGATPGLGDTMKKLDKKGLDEEHHLCDVIDAKTRQLMKEHLGIEAQTIFDIVKGTHPCHATALLHSPHLDLDKIAYTSLDASHYINMCDYDLELPGWYSPIHTHPDIKHLIGKTPTLYERIKETLSNHPLLFDIHKDISIIPSAGGRHEAVFSNPERAYHVLKLRALLATHLYLSDESRAKEAGYSHHLFSPLYGRGVFCAENLRRMTDREAAFTLLATLAEIEGLPVGYGKNKHGVLVPYQTQESDCYIINFGEGHRIMRYFKPMTAGAQPYLIRRFSSEAEARTHAARHGHESDGVYVHYFNGYNAGEHTLVRHNGNIVPLHTARPPGEITELLSIRDQSRGWFMLWPNLEYWELFKDIQELHKKAAANPRGNDFPPTECFTDD